MNNKEVYFGIVLALFGCASLTPKPWSWSSQVKRPMRVAVISMAYNSVPQSALANDKKASHKIGKPLVPVVVDILHDSHEERVIEFIDQALASVISELQPNPAGIEWVRPEKGKEATVFDSFFSGGSEKTMTEFVMKYRLLDETAQGKIFKVPLDAFLGNRVYLQRGLKSFSSEKLRKEFGEFATALGVDGLLFVEMRLEYEPTSPGDESLLQGATALLKTQALVLTNNGEIAATPHGFFPIVTKGGAVGPTVGGNMRWTKKVISAYLDAFRQAMHRLRETLPTQ